MTILCTKHNLFEFFVAILNWETGDMELTMTVGKRDIYYNIYHDNRTVETKKIHSVSLLWLRIVYLIFTDTCIN